MRIKSFLVGCVGGFIALTSAQAADLPVKAKPVEYVKICSLYGPGFYYIPGTDMCLKVGGYVRAQYEWNSTQGLPFGSTYNGLYTSPVGSSPNPSIVNARFERSGDSLQFTGRTMLTVDARNQSEYGTIRGYLRIGGLMNSPESATFVAERAFIQFAGFTFGQAQSFFDIFHTTEVMSYFDAKTSGDTYNYGVKVLGYTAQFGNGLSGTVSAELGHYKSVYGVANAAMGPWQIGRADQNTAGFSMPDIVGNLRWDQSWGYVGVSGAIHQVAAAYYGGANAEINGHPDNKYGWAASVGGQFYLPWLGAGDSIGANFVYSKGALGYVTKAGGAWAIAHDNSIGVGWAQDGIYDNNIPNFGAGRTPIELTNAWSITAGYEHFWNPRWRTSLYGGYTRVWYDQNATNIVNQHLPTPPAGGLACGVAVEGAVMPPLSIANGQGNSCSPNFSFWQVGSRTQWNVTKDFYMGVDVTYTHLNTAYQGVAPNPPPTVTGAIGNLNSRTAIDDQSVVSAMFRAQVNFEAGNDRGGFAPTSAAMGAMAADFPVKAPPVQYVRICSLYGVGFYYIPGTDICLKVGGYVRAQYEWGSTQGLPFGSSYNGVYSASNLTNALFTRQSDNIQFTGRAMLSADARSQSEYGTVRAYLLIGAQLANADAPTFVPQRAFIQFAGFTFGQAQSFFDIFSTTELMSYFDAKTSGDTFNYGVKVLAYTAQFGNGFSGTISAEVGHYRNVYGVADGSAAAFAPLAVVLTDTAGLRMPDIVGNLRWDQNWGYVGVSGAIHQVAGQYFGPGNQTTNGHPDDKYGWAASAGGLFYLPWLGGGDSIGANFVYSKGAVGYATKAGSWQIAHGDSAGVGWAVDGLFDGPALPATGQTQIHLTNAWSVNAGYEHFWNPRWRTSLYGGYTRVWYDAQIKNDINSHLPGAVGTTPCGIPVGGAVWPAINIVQGDGNSCSPNFSFWQVGSRTQWNVNSAFYMGVDVTYTHLNTAYEGVRASGLFAPGGAKLTSVALDDQSVVSAIFRAQMNFEAGSVTPGRSYWSDRREREGLN